MKKKNPWKAATVILMILAIGLMAYSYYFGEKILDVDGFKISESNLELFMEQTGTDEEMKICNFETEECRTFSWNKP